MLELEGSLSEKDKYLDRPRVCNLGYLRTPFLRDDKIQYRCASEPIDDYRKCLLYCQNERDSGKRARSRQLLGSMILEKPVRYTVRSQRNAFSAILTWQPPKLTCLIFFNCAVKKGGDMAATEGRKCLCNALMANAGLPQVRVFNFRQQALSNPPAVPAHEWYSLGLFM